VTAESPDYRQGHVLLATAYYRLKDKEKGDREQALAEKLRAAEQAQEPGASAPSPPPSVPENPR
jgi:hypothetical protein